MRDRGPWTILCVFCKNFCNIVGCNYSLGSFYVWCHNRKLNWGNYFTKSEDFITKEKLRKLQKINEEIFFFHEWICVQFPDKTFIMIHFLHIFLY